MKSLILKDLYNIGHNMKSMLLVLVILAVGLISSAGTESYVVASGVICGTMVITTFSFDNMSKWPRYAMIMPVSRKDLVASKFIVLLIFAVGGAIAGLVNRDASAVEPNWFAVYGNLWQYFNSLSVQIRCRAGAYADVCLVYRSKRYFLRDL